MIIDLDRLNEVAARDAAAEGCGCGAACWQIDAWCKHCAARGSFHVAEGDVHPVLYWTCPSERHTFEQPLMSDAQIVAESRKGGWH